MNLKPHPPTSRPFIGGFVVLALATAALFLLLGAPSTPVFAGNAQKIYDTVAEFNLGRLYHTGLTADSANGGDGDGEVRILNTGIDPDTWNQGGGNNTGLPGRWGHGAALYDDRIYVSGGNTTPISTSSLNSVHFSTIQGDHNLSNWTATSTLPGKRYLHAMVSLNGYLYLIGGLNELAAPQSTVYKAQVNANGTLGAWAATGALPLGLSDLTAVVSSGKIFVLGGQNSSGVSQNTVYYATPDGSGNISSWSAGGALTSEVSRHASAASDSAIHMAGGAKFTLMTSSFFPEVYFGTGTASWTETDPLPVNLVYASGVQYSSQLYIVGGAFNNGSTLENNIRTNLMNPDNTLIVGGWTSSNVLSAARQRTAAVVSSDGWIYVIQGQSGNLATGGTPLATIDFGPTVTAGGQSYAPSGQYTSEVIDLLSSRPIQSLVFNTSVTSGTALSFEYRASDFSNFSDTSYQSAGSAPLGNHIDTTKPLNVSKRYVQFRANFVANHPANDKSPVLNQVTVNYDSAGATNTPTPTRTTTATGTTPQTPTLTPTVTATSCAVAPAKVLLAKPKNKGKVKKRRVKLKWNRADCAEKYKVIVRKGSKKGKTVFRKKVKFETETKTEKLKKGQRYFWRVRGRNDVGWGDWSDWWKFKIRR